MALSAKTTMRGKTAMMRSWPGWGPLDRAAEAGPSFAMRWTGQYC